MIKRICIYVGSALLVAIAAFSWGAYDTLRPSADTLFAEGNAYYDAGQYEKAIATYEHIIRDGVSDAASAYNLGNAYLKNGALGKAILWYERSRLFAPRDTDNLSNLRYAKSLMKQKDPTALTSWFFAMLDQMFDLITIDEGRALALFFYYLVVVGTITAIFMPLRRRSLGMIVMVGLVLLALTAPALTRKQARATTDAIIMTPITDARFEPFKAALVHFPLYEGMRVSVLTSRDSWYKIKRSDGKIGWVEEGTLERIAL